MLCTLKSAALVGVDALPVEVEVAVSGGLPGFHLVGLPAGAVREGSVRILAAIRSAGFEIGSAKVTVNLAPADLRKEGAAFELPIALGALASRGAVALARRDILFAGELSLDGRLRPVRGALSLAESARAQGLAGVALPAANAPEAALVQGLAVYPLGSLGEAARFAAGELAIPPAEEPRLAARGADGVDFAEVTGQEEARLAAEVAAAGGHNLMLIGPPGGGKTMVARRMGTILPPLTRAEAIETTRVHSVAGVLGERALVDRRPFRAPHHTCSGAGLVGGGSTPRPGEVSLAHNGVLFLDELPEFPRASLEALRQPLEDGRVTVVRARTAVTFPARFMMVAAMNPCPCGFRGSGVRTCTCGEKQARRYLGRISGPLLDRFDLFVHVTPVAGRALLEARPAESSAEMAARVARARARQAARFRRSAIHCNAQMSTRQIRRWVPLGERSRDRLVRYAELHRLSARAIHRTCRVARTLADMAARDAVTDDDLTLALTLQRGRWHT